MVKHAVWLCIATLGCATGCTRQDAPAAAAPATVAPADAAVGARLYSGNCLPCHQQDARGLAGVYPSLVGSPVLLGDPRDLTLWVIKGRRPVSMPAGRYSTMMRQFGWMKASDAAALFTYLRSNFGKAAAVDAATVAAALSQ
jgi:mono/diheme cytochrome c family protein